MTIKKHTNLELTEGTTHLTATSSSLQGQVDAPILTQLKNKEFSCLKCHPRRSIVFLREHTYLKRDPVIVTCPNCLQGVETIVERQSTSTTHLSALLLLLVCFCIVPYCSKILRDSVHRCPSCGIALGVHFASAREAFVARCIGAQRDQRNE